MGYIFNCIKKLKNIENHDQAFKLKKHIGNFTLLVLGVYPERVRPNLKMPPFSMNMIELIATNHFYLASNHDDPRSPLFIRLYDNFRKVRLAVNLMSEYNFFEFQEQSNSWIL